MWKRCGGFRTVMGLGIIFYLYVCFFVLLLPWLCGHLPYSKYYSVERNDPQIVKRLLAENDARIAKAKCFIDDYEARNNNPGPLKEQFDVVVAVITMNRDSEKLGKLGYLTQTISSVLSLFEEDHSETFKSKHLLVCNVDVVEHREAIELSKIVRVVSRYENVTSRRAASNSEGIFEKEKEDYVYCMRQVIMNSKDPHFILILEDDILLRNDSLRILNHLLNSRIAPHEPHREWKPWLFVKLFYPEKWQGYGNELDKISELVGLAILGGTLTVLVVHLLTGSLLRLGFASGSPTRRRFFRLVFALGAGTTVATALLVGRLYIQSWRSHSPYLHRIVPAPDCCTQAMLYPAGVVPGLTQYLDGVTCTMDFSIDLAIDRYAKETGLLRHLVEPNLGRHVGFVSTVRGYSKSAAEFLE